MTFIEKSRISSLNVVKWSTSLNPTNDVAYAMTTDSVVIEVSGIPAAATTTTTTIPTTTTTTTPG